MLKNEKKKKLVTSDQIELNGCINILSFRQFTEGKLFLN